MAHLSQNFWGVVLILDHAETQSVLAVANDVAGIVYRIGDALDDTDLAIVGYILDAVAVGISLNAVLVEQCDQGNGVYITSPWVVLGTIIPSTRALNIGLPSRWALAGSGTFSTEDAGDLISYDVERGAVDPAVVEFELRAHWVQMWRKVLVLRDGLGNQWDIAISPTDGTFSARNGLWSDQVHNGQQLSLWKAKELGLMTWVLDVGHLDDVPAGSRVVLTWWRDK